MSPQLSLISPQVPLWRVGRRPEPWAWTPWEYSGGARWDDAEGNFRTVYAAESRFACFVELLATYRPDPAVAAVMADIVVDPDDAKEFPTRLAGEIPRNWVDRHLISSAFVDGQYCDMTTAETIAALRPTFIAAALEAGLADFDAAALKNSSPRQLTQSVATFLYQIEGDDRLLDGLRFGSRFGDELSVWAIFERPADEPFSRQLRIQTEDEIARADPDIKRAMNLHGLVWEPRD